MMPATESAAASAHSAGSISEADIARLAFHFYCERGCRDGHDLDDWLRAERELRGATAFTAA